uniref:Augerpeptide hhe6.1 n=1 Tax=Hastula hectica TaxID=745793 RepID=TE61_HASHE|nr:RecName: Full=Augerpeptide hhe6.1 [Hastula hectica]
GMGIGINLPPCIKNGEYCNPWTGSIILGGACCGTCTDYECH